MLVLSAILLSFCRYVTNYLNLQNVLVCYKGAYLVVVDLVVIHHSGVVLGLLGLLVVDWVLHQVLAVVGFCHQGVVGLLVVLSVVLHQADVVVFLVVEVVSSS